MSSLRVGPYEVIQKLAAGGMAEVFLARRPGPAGFEKRVVLKRISRKLRAESEVAAMFRDEANVQALLDHPNIVQIYDYGEDQGFPYIAMEFVKGATLRWLVDNSKAVLRPIPLQHSLRIACDILAGLHFAHERKDEANQPLNLVHRDISPVNILIGRNGIAKLCDFGVAKSKIQSTHTQVGVVKGKFRYMAPEQLNGQGVSRQTDVFAVGLCLWEMLVGRRLFDETKETGVISAIRSGDYPQPSSVRPELPRAIDRLLMRALKLEPERRFQSARDMHLACEELLRVLPRASNSVLLGEYVSAELDGLIGLAPDRKKTRKPISDTGSATIFQYLDPPVPTQPTQVSSPREDYADELTEAIGSPSLFSRFLSTALLVPAGAFAGIATAAQSIGGLASRKRREDEIKVTRTTSPE